MLLNIGGMVFWLDVVIVSGYHAFFVERVLMSAVFRFSTPIGLYVMLALMCSSGQIAADLYLGTMPTIASALQVHAPEMQRTMSLFLLAYLVVQFMSGWLCDTYGRRLPSAVGLLVGILGSLVCAACSSWEVLMLGRLLQGGGFAVVLTAGRALTRDMNERAGGVAQTASLLTAVNITMISSAPFLGSYVGQYWHWRANFFIMAGMAALCAVLVWLGIGEDRPRQPDLSARDIYVSYRAVFRNRSLMLYSTMSACLYACLLGYGVVAPFILQQTLGLSMVAYAWYNISVSAAGILASVLNHHILKVSTPQRQIRRGLWLLGTGLVWMLTSLWAQPHVLWVIIPMWFYMAGSMFLFPNLFALLMSSAKDGFGTMSSVYGAMQILGGVTSSYLLSLDQHHRLGIFVMLVAGVSSIGVWCCVKAGRT